jgi:WD40 repeat protein
VGSSRRGFVQRLVFSKDGNQLLVGVGPNAVPACHVWDIRPKAKPEAPLLALPKTEDFLVAWSADNALFANRYISSIRVYQADGKTEQRIFTRKQLLPEFGGGFSLGGLHFLGTTDKVVAGAAHREDDSTAPPSVTVVLLDPQTGNVERLYRGPVQIASHFTTAVSSDGKLLAVTGDPGYEVILWDIATNKEIRRLGVSSPAPRFVGWWKDSRSIAWGVTLKKGQPRVEALTAGLNLTTLEPLGEAERKDLQPGQWNPDKWTISNEKVKFERTDPSTGNKIAGTRLGVALIRPDGAPGDKRIETPIPGWLTAWTFYQDSKDKQDRVAIGVETTVDLYDPKTNKVVYNLDLRDATRVEDVAVSPDGKYLLMAGGNQALALYHIEGKPERLLSILVAGEDWVAWTPQGYYAATPGGEKLIGWQVKQDDLRPLTFYPVQRFRKLFYKPEVIKQLLAKGSVKEALKAAKTEEVQVEEALPPTVRMKVESIQEGGKDRLRVTAEAKAGAKKQPVEWLRLLLDGRAHPDAEPVEIKAGAASAEWKIDPLPAGRHELKVLARCPDVSGASEAYSRYVKAAAADRPVLYRVCVGINDYDEKGLGLKAAKEDAEAVFDALEKDCTNKGGKENLFQKAKGRKLLDKDATRQAVLDALRDVRKRGAKPGDLLVVFFAGHGVVQDGDFFLLTREADPGKPLQGRSLSGQDLQEALAAMPCSVLLLMDACHSAAGVPRLKLRPATDDLTRSLTDDQVAVTVLAAAMGYETAGERPGHGLFTEAVLDGLKAAGGSRVDRLLYVHHLYAHVFDAVRDKSGGKQHPFLNMPWTVPPLALRQVP